MVILVGMGISNMKEQIGYMIIDKVRPLLVSSTMPIYWYKRTAIKDAKIYGSK